MRCAAQSHVTSLKWTKRSVGVACKGHSKLFVECAWCLVRAPWCLAMWFGGFLDRALAHSRITWLQWPGQPWFSLILGFWSQKIMKEQNKNCLLICCILSLVRPHQLDPPGPRDPWHLLLTHPNPCLSHLAHCFGIWFATFKVILLEICICQLEIDRRDLECCFDGIDFFDYLNQSTPLPPPKKN